MKILESIGILTGKIKELRTAIYEHIEPQLGARVSTVKNSVITFFGVGFPADLVDRFLFEHLLRYKEKNIHYILLGGSKNASEAFGTRNHIMLIIGHPHIEESLLIRKGEFVTFEREGSCPLQIKNFFDQQAAEEELILVDPFLDAIGSVSEIWPILETYCARNSITHVFGAKSCECLTDESFAYAKEKISFFVKELKVDPHFSNLLAKYDKRIADVTLFAQPREKPETKKSVYDYLKNTGSSALPILEEAVMRRLDSSR